MSRKKSRHFYVEIKSHNHVANYATKDVTRMFNLVTECAHTCKYIEDVLCAFTPYDVKVRRRREDSEMFSEFSTLSLEKAIGAVKNIVLMEMCKASKLVDTKIEEIKTTINLPAYIEADLIQCFWNQVFFNAVVSDGAPFDINDDKFIDMFNAANDLSISKCSTDAFGKHRFRINLDAEYAEYSDHTIIATSLEYKREYAEVDVKVRLKA